MTPKKSEGKCSECGGWFSIEKMSPQSKSLCKTCYAKLWDEGFSSQAEYSDQQFEIQQRKYDRMNEKLNVENIDIRDLQKSINSFTMTTVKCRKCGKLRVSMEKYRTLKGEGRLLDFLKQPCPKCNTEGFLFFS